MQGAVAIVVRRFDIVLPLDDLQILLALDHLRYAVDVVDVAAHDAHARNIVDILHGGLQRQGQALFQQLGHDALGGFYAALDMVDGVACIQHVEFAVQNLKF